MTRALLTLNGWLGILMIVLIAVRLASGPGWTDTAGPVLVGVMTLTSLALAGRLLSLVAHDLPRRHRIAKDYARSDR